MTAIQTVDQILRVDHAGECGAMPTIPYLRQHGVSLQQIHAITVENPKRFFPRSEVPGHG